jgi:hypothetical protein
MNWIGQNRRKWFLLIAVVGALSLSGCSGSGFLNRLYTETPTETLTASATATPSATFTASATQTTTATASQTASATATSSITPSSTAVPPTDTITAGPSPTQTKTATRTPRTPTTTLTPTETLTPSPTLTPTITLTPTPHLAFLRLSKPGWMSKVVSPILLSSIASPGEDGHIFVNLIGEDGRVITHLDQRYYTRDGQRFLFDPKIEYSIPGPAEYARLEIRTRDKWGRDISISSVDLLLLSVGGDEIFDPISLFEPYIIWAPREGAILSGGAVLVNGLVQPVNQSPVIFELVDAGGKVVGSSKMEAPIVESGQTHAEFTQVVPYKLDAGADVRLIIRQESVGRIPGTVALTSMHLILAP